MSAASRRSRVVHDLHDEPGVRVTLVHNPKAGDKRIPDCRELVAELEELGWKVRPIDKRAVGRAIEEPGDLVVVAGGDGTVGKIAKLLAGTGVPMAVIPTGTANNVARTLGVGVEPRAAIDGLRNAVLREVDLGVVTGDATNDGDAEERFLEGLGFGVFAYVMAERATKKHKKLRRAFGLLAKELETYEPHHATIAIDGRDLSGEYLLVSVMNLRSLGPALGLAPDAHFDDGALDVVLVRPEQKASLVAHLRRAALEGDIALPRFELHRAEHVRFASEGRWAHVDDCPRAYVGAVDVRVEPRAVAFLLPPPQGTVLAREA